MQSQKAPVVPETDIGSNHFSCSSLEEYGKSHKANQRNLFQTQGTGLDVQRTVQTNQRPG